MLVCCKLACNIWSSYITYYLILGCYSSFRRAPFSVVYYAFHWWGSRFPFVNSLFRVAIFCKIEMKILRVKVRKRVPFVQKESQPFAGQNKCKTKLKKSTDIFFCQSLCGVFMVCTSLPHLKTCHVFFLVGGKSSGWKSWPLRCQQCKTKTGSS